MRNSIGTTQKRSTYLVRLDIAASLIAAYVELGEDMKELFERFLAFQVYTRDGTEMQPYLPSYLLTSADSGDPIRPHSTDERPVLYVFEIWFDWAQLIKGTALNPIERRAAVRAMLGVLIRQKDRRRLGGLELREAAKGTLGWTRWDAKHLAELRRNGFSTTAEFEAWHEKEIARALEGGKRSRPETQPV
jgi:hypothetical protein